MADQRLVARRVTAPTSAAVTLAEAKTHLRVDINDDDALITALTIAATDFCETYQNRAYAQQAWEVVSDGWPSFPLELPRATPLQSATITYTKSDGTTVTLQSSDVVLDTTSTPGRVYLSDSFTKPDDLATIGTVKIQYVVGYADTADIPQLFKQAVLLLIGAWYEQREATADVRMTEVPFAVKAILGPDVVVNIFT